MRHALVFALLLGLALLTTSARAGEVDLVRVWPQWRSADSFDRIREYFGGNENEGREIIARTQADQREGLYLLVRLKSVTAVKGAKFVLEMIRPDAPEPKTFTFSVDLPAKAGVVLLGLTGNDWPGGRGTHPVAWHLTLVDGSGQTLAEEKSFLWEKPAK